MVMIAHNNDLKIVIQYNIYTTSIKGVKGFVPLLENTYNTPVQRYFKSDKGKQDLANACSKYQKKNNIIVKSVIEI